MVTRAKPAKPHAKAAKQTPERHKSQLNRHSRKVMGQHYRAKYGVK
ncbi:MAG: hypothetical protein ABI771_06335 [Betaproteobacteria bacterium]